MPILHPTPDVHLLLRIASTHHSNQHPPPLTQTLKAVGFSHVATMTCWGMLTGGDWLRVSTKVQHPDTYAAGAVPGAFHANFL